MIRLTPNDKRASIYWNELVTSVISASDINLNDTPSVVQARKKRLEADNEAWFAYYFEEACKNQQTGQLIEPAQFHKQASRRIMNMCRWYEVRAWSRELAKSTRAMMEICKLALTGQIKNVLLISNSYANAERLLMPFMAHFEENKRIQQDYDTQKKIGQWEMGEFTCQCGCAFRAVGAGQSPRGTRNKNFRPDFILIDDIDTDEECRNPQRIDEKWKWLEKALLPAMSISGNYRILFNGNIIAKNCCINMANVKMRDVEPKIIITRKTIRNNNKNRL